MSYNQLTNSFNLTMKKMHYWHRHSNHRNQSGCCFCEGDFKAIKSLLKKQGIKVLDQGHSWVKIEARRNVRVETFGTTSDEVDLLFKIVTGSEQL